MSLNPPRLSWLRPAFLRRASAFLLGWLLCCWPCGGLAQSGAAGDYATRSWTVEEGLPHNTVNRVLQDERGYLWAATGAGLARFDGVAFTEFALPQEGRPAGGNIRDLVRSGSNRSLLLPATGGVWECADGQLRPHPISASLAGESLLDLFAEPGGAVWVTTAPARIIRWANGRVQSFGPEAGIVRRVNRITFAIDGGGRTWVAAGEFLGYFAEDRLVPVGPSLANVGTAFVIAPARTGGIWLATAEQLMRSEDGRFVTVYRGADWPAKASGIESLFEDRHGNLWIGSRRRGLFRYAAGRISAVPTSARMIPAIIEDRDGNIWAATATDGLVRLRARNYTLLDHTRGLRETLSSSVCVDAAGVVWCANRSGGLARYRDEQIDRLTTHTRLDHYATRVAPDLAGNIWAAADTGLFRLRADAPEQIVPAEPALAGVRLIFTSRGGDVWVASAQGLGFFRAGVYHEVFKDQEETRARFNAIAEDSQGRLWLAGSQLVQAVSEVRLWEYAAGQLVERTAADAWPGGHVLSLRIDGNDRLWLGTTAGLVLKAGDRLIRLGAAEGLPDEFIAEQLTDAEGRVWMGARRGFFRVSAQALLDVAEGRTTTVLPTVFGRDDGLQGAVALGLGQPRAWHGPDGRLWFTSHRGIVGFDPKTLSPGGAPPAIYLETISCDGQQRPVGNGPVVVGPEVRRITFRFAVLNLSAPEQIHVRHRLEDYDRDWVDAQDDRSATYSRLPAGKYRLRVIAANQSGVWNREGASLDLVVQAPWWQTSWFLAGLALAISALIAWAARTWSLRKMRRQLDELARQHELEQERARIARNLHDELGGSLTQIGLLAERVKRRSPGELEVLLTQLASRTRRLSGDLETIVWAISPHNNTWDRLASFIARFADRFFRDTPIRCTVSGVEHVPALPLGPETQHEILAVLKETLNNALKHSRATSVHIAVQVVDGVFELRIADDGVGFDPLAKEHSERNGLSNIRTRATALGGEAVITSRPGEGSAITLRVPALPERSVSDPPAAAGQSD